jgi:hypothetical protein
MFHKTGAGHLDNVHHLLNGRPRELKVDSSVKIRTTYVA